MTSTIIWHYDVFTQSGTLLAKGGGNLKCKVNPGDLPLNLETWGIRYLHWMHWHWLLHGLWPLVNALAEVRRTKVTIYLCLQWMHLQKVIEQSWLRCVCDFRWECTRRRLSNEGDYPLSVTFTGNVFAERRQKSVLSHCKDNNISLLGDSNKTK